MRTLVRVVLWLLLAMLCLPVVGLLAYGGFNELWVVMHTQHGWIVYGQPSPGATVYTVQGWHWNGSCRFPPSVMPPISPNSGIKGRYENELALNPSTCEERVERGVIYWSKK